MKRLLIMFSMIMILGLSACTSGTDEKGSLEAVDDVEDSIEETQDVSNEVPADEGAEVSNDAAKEDVAEEPEREKIMAPDFTLYNKAGDAVSLSDYRGKIVFLNFFATWCGYCEEEMPDFQAASEKYGDEVVFLIVDAFTTEQISKEEVFEWYESRGFTMEMVIDEEGILSNDYPIQGYPTTFFIDPEGYVIAYYPGLMSEEIIDQVISEIK